MVREWLPWKQINISIETQQAERDQGLFKLQRSQRLDQSCLLPQFACMLQHQLLTRQYQAEY